MDSTSLRLKKKKSYNDIINSTTIYYNDYSLFNISYNEELHDFIIKLFNDEIVIREENINPRYYYIVGIYYFSISYNLNEAIKWFQLAYDKINDIKYLNYLIFAYYEKGDYEKAVELSLKPGNNTRDDRQNPIYFFVPNTNEYRYYKSWEK